VLAQNQHELPEDMGEAIAGVAIHRDAVADCLEAGRRGRGFRSGAGNRGSGAAADPIDHQRHTLLLLF